MKDRTKPWKWALSIDILMHLAAVGWFAFLPPNTLSATERLVMVAATFAAIGVISYVLPFKSLPCANWSYMLSGSVCLLTFLVYETYAYQNRIPSALAVPFGLFLLAGAISSYAAHIIDRNMEV